MVARYDQVVDGLVENDRRDDEQQRRNRVVDKRLGGVDRDERPV
jgi:hypothetical protein